MDGCYTEDGVEVGIVSEVIAIPFGNKATVLITGLQILLLILSSSSGMQETEVQSFFSSNVLGSII